MKISDHIRHSLDACDRRELDAALLFACLAIDGTAKKTYPDINSVGKRFRKFIGSQIDIIELFFGGINLKETTFPFLNNQGRTGLKFEDIVYEKFRCDLAHGNEFEEGYGIELKIAEHHHQFKINLETKSMTMPESSIFALGLACVLAPANKDQRIGNNQYFYSDGINQYVVDRWWGKVECAYQIMDFEKAIRVKLNL
jgi:hypothetical protein